MRLSIATAWSDDEQIGDRRTASTGAIVENAKGIDRERCRGRGAFIPRIGGAPGVLKEVDGLVSLPLPEELEVPPTYGLAVLSDNPEAARFSLFILSAAGQGILSHYGFLPVASSK